MIRPSPLVNRFTTAAEMDAFWDSIPVAPPGTPPLTREQVGDMTDEQWRARFRPGVARELTADELADPVVARFLARVEPQEDGCWWWTGAIGSHRYGTFYVPGGKVPAHRASWELYVGPIAEGLVVDHICRVTRCVNPAHLEPVSRHENAMRGVLADPIRPGLLWQAEQRRQRREEYERGVAARARLRAKHRAAHPEPVDGCSGCRHYYSAAERRAALQLHEAGGSPRPPGA